MRDYKSKILFIIIFSIYCLLMGYLLFGRSSQTNPSYNLIPFFTIKEFIEILKDPDSDLKLFSFINLLGNIIMFMPLGFLPPIIFKKLRPLSATLIFSSITIITVEMLQFFSAKGIADIDDFLLNTFGVMIGHFICKKYLTNRNINC